MTRNDRPALFEVLLKRVAAGCPVVVIRGEFDAARVDEFEQTLAGLSPSDRQVEVDLTSVTILDSAALGALLRLKQWCERNGAVLGLVAPQEYQIELFTMTGLRHLLDRPR